MTVQQVGKYEIRGRLGAGAMGTVMDAFDVVIERRAALKVIPRPATGDVEGEESLARFKREAQAAGRLNHPNIVAVYDYGEDHENAWIAMELVEGGTLKQMLDRRERFPVTEIVRLMDQILAGLDYSHKRGVVHRDIKPANIMLTADGTVKIADFGIARIENSSMTQVGTVMGTPSYMAPEQLRGEPVDARADIWASGVLLYQLLTGEKPFEGGFSAVQHKAIHTEPTPPSTLSVTSPRAFDAVVSQAMAKRPEDRFATAAAFAEAIRAALTAPSAAAPAQAPLPMVDSDATVVSGTMRPAPSAPAPAPSPSVSAPAKSGPPVMLIGGGVAAALVAGAAAFLLLGRDPAPQPTPSSTTVALTPVSPPTASTPAAPVAAPPAVDPPRPTSTATTSPPPSPPAASPAPAPPSQATAPPPAPPLLVPPAQTPAVPSTAAAPPASTPLLTPPPAAFPPTGGSGNAATASTEAPIPPAPPQQIALAPRAVPDFRAAAQAAAAAPACGLIAYSASDDALSLEGVLRRGQDDTLRRALAARDIPLAATRLAVQGFDGPYCPATDVLRPYLASPDLAPQVRPVGNLPLINGQLLRFDVTMPEWGGNLYVAYFMKSGEVAHLVPSAPHPGNSTVRLGEPRAGFPGWEVSEPFGTDLLVAIVSEGPLFAVARPVVEKQEAYLAALADALRDARQQNRRVQIRPFVIETAAR